MFQRCKEEEKALDWSLKKSSWRWKMNHRAGSDGMSVRWVAAWKVKKECQKKEFLEVMLERLSWWRWGNEPILDSWEVCGSERRLAVRKADVKGFLFAYFLDNFSYWYNFTLSENCKTSTRNSQKTFSRFTRYICPIYFIVLSLIHIHISGSSQFICCWSLAWRSLSITLLACKMNVIVGSLNILWHCSSLGLECKLTFLVLWPLLVFPNLLAYWVQHFNNIIF